MLVRSRFSGEGDYVEVSLSEEDDRIIEKEGIFQLSLEEEIIFVVGSDSHRARLLVFEHDACWGMIKSWEEVWGSGKEGSNNREGEENEESVEGVEGEKAMFRETDKKRILG